MAYALEDTKRLSDYINKQLKSGYDITTIRNFLIANGYSSTLVDASIDLIYGKSESIQASSKVLKTRTNNSYKLIVACVLVLVVILGVIFGLNKIPSNENVDEISLEPKTPLGNKNNLRNDDLININTEKSNTLQNTNKAEEEIKKNIAETNENPKYFEPTIYEIDELINLNSETDSQKLCEGLKDEYKKNSCYKKLAIKSDNPEYCENINKINLKDNCYFIFAFAGKSQFCEKIQDTYQRLTCNSYGKAKQEESL